MTTAVAPDRRTNIPSDRINRFHPGQVWQTSRGCLWRVERIEHADEPVAVFRLGLLGRGCIQRKNRDDIGQWSLYYDPEYDQDLPPEQYL